MTEVGRHGVFVGRLSPIHVGHEQVIDHMIDTCGLDNSTVVIGSSNTPTSMRHFFSYEERRDLVNTLYPDICIMGVPDFPTDKEWLLALDDQLAARRLGAAVTFFGGSDEDVRFFTDADRSVEIVNRFDGTTLKISASEVRDALLHEREVSEMLNPAIAHTVVKLFAEHWEKFRNT